MSDPFIPFHRSYLADDGRQIAVPFRSGDHLAGDGPYTDQCQAWLKRHTGNARVLLTHSCTAALEMAALLLDVAQGDEIIMPSYTFTSTANAFVLRGGVPVFVDVRADTFNIDERLIEQAITPRTRAIVVVHYAGLACAMDSILSVAARHGLTVVEDAAQGLMSAYRGKALGTLGQIGTLSFHETKNVTAGEGGALLINNPGLESRAEILREKGTDRTRFRRGEVDKYTWQDVGSSFLPSDILAALLMGQLQAAPATTAERLALWNGYHAALAAHEEAGLLRRPHIPEDCQGNGHIYFVTLAPHLERTRVIEALKAKGVGAASHYVPLHASPAGRRFGRVAGGMKNTDIAGEKLIRLPVWPGLTQAQQSRVIDALSAVLASQGHST